MLFRTITVFIRTLAHLILFSWVHIEANISFSISSTFSSHYILQISGNFLRFSERDQLNFLWPHVVWHLQGTELFADFRVSRRPLETGLPIKIINVIIHRKKNLISSYLWSFYYSKYLICQKSRRMADFRRNFEKPFVSSWPDFGFDFFVSLKDIMMWKYFGN